ncbi:SDR family NAD(P)-dependent oxidoreductase [Halomonas sp. LBP4]|uniref:SDR family NAD(P)-dependent oxidoreductase n=1 Tax=Halomonas sp. LBP4 TaxID=2044917 RepID=UPI000D770F02|nr:SDR family NAD(P)-dependent oxidoreductase [Halomonas sp. LBP4]PXY00332.1 short-chain dehydrogenase [Halomonas sp. LBP4]
MNTLKRDDGLAGKVAIISGAASGIGQALAVSYAKAGVKVVAGYYPGDPHDVEETVSAVREAGGECVAVAVDVRDGSQCDALAQAAIDTFGALDIAVAGAGILRQASLHDLSDEAWNDMLSVDLTGVMRVFRAASRVMAGPGAMVAISSIAGGVYGWDDHAHYAAAKSGLMGLVKSLAVELAPRSIRVNTLVPGLIETPQSLDPVNSLGPEGLAAAGKLIPSGRVGRAEEVARTVRFLTSDDATYVTGQQLIVDGGLTVRWPS